MSNRMPWAQRPMRGMQPARDCAIAAEQILQNYVSDPVQLDRILNTIELSVHQALATLARGGSGSTGFDPSTGAPSRSRVDYTHRARTASEIQQQMELERQGRAAVAHHGTTTPQHSDMIADPALALEREAMRHQQQMPRHSPPNQPQRLQQPNVNPNRPDSDTMPWL